MAAHVVAGHPEQGWSLPCNGVVVFDDAGALLPDGRALDPSCRRHSDQLCSVAEPELSALARNTRQAAANPGEKGFLDYAPPRPGMPHADPEG